MRGSGRKLAVAALVAISVGAVASAGLSSAPADPTAQSAKKKGKGKGKGKGKKPKKPKAPQAPSDTERVVFVGNNWDGTADVLRFVAPSEPAKAKKRCKRAKRKGAKRSAEASGKKRRCKRKGAQKRVAEAAKRRGCKRKAKRGAEASKRKRRGCKRKQKPGTATDASFKRIARLNIVPDLDERMAEIITDPVRLGYFLAVRGLVGEGNDQFVDDMYSTNDGRLLIVSRPSLRDVIALNIATGKIVWRFVVAGQRSDHMAISPDGKHVAVSASTGNVVHILDTQTGQQVGQFPSGDSPHENTYSKDGSRIFHASIGLVYTPADLPILDTTKGARYFQIVDGRSFQILRRVDMGQKLEEAGYPNMSSAVRPMAISPDERFVYLQVSFFHGVVEYDVLADRVTRVGELPNLVPNTPRELYLLDSAHHGIAMNERGNRLCIAGTMSDYAAIVARDNFADYSIFQGGSKPYWSTTDDTGDYCFVSWSGSDRVSAISYSSGKEVAKIQVGDHPQRVRTGAVRKDWVASVGG
jgi:DNA-binding beta-propeller fold protein YncE